MKKEEKTLINSILNFFKDVRPQLEDINLEKMTLKPGEVIIISEDGEVKMEATGELAPDGKHELMDGSFVETIGGKIVPKKEDVAASDVEVVVDKPEEVSVEELKAKIAELEAKLSEKMDLYNKKEVQMSDLESKLKSIEEKLSQKDLELSKLTKIKSDKEVNLSSQSQKSDDVQRILSMMRKK